MNEVMQQYRGVRRLLAALCLACAAVLSMPPQGSAEQRALARLDAARSGVAELGEELLVTLALTQAVPWRAGVLADPPRLVLDFREVGWEGIDPARFVGPAAVQEVRWGLFRPGWSRLVLALADPMELASAEMRTDPAEGSAVVAVRLRAGTPQGLPETGIDGLWSLRDRPRARPDPPRAGVDRPLRVVLDPGHGGIDPGAEYGGHREADLMLTFARELKEALVLAGGFEVFLTREEDVFVSLLGRVSLARSLGADVFISLHADAVAQGRATGTTIYTLSDTASDAVAAALAEQHDRADLLAGVDLSRQDDTIAQVLMDLARLETAPRSTHLAEALVAGIRAQGTRLYRRPHLAAGFSVLRAPDIPSVLIEVGFMSDPRDLANLLDPEWRARVAAGIVAALDTWAREDAARAPLMRQ